MQNLKFPVIFASFGFALSLIFGFFSHAGFGWILLRALIFAAVFFGLAFAIHIITQKFLKDDGSSELDTESSSAASYAQESALKGQHVDLVVQDEELDSETSENHYIVGQNHQMLSESDLSSKPSASSPSAGPAAGSPSNAQQASSSAQNNSANNAAPNSMPQNNVTQNNAPQTAAPDNSNNGFIPIKTENVTNLSGTEAVKSANVQAVAVSNSSNSSDSLDVLPDMSDLNLEAPKEGSEQSDRDDVFETSSSEYSKKTEAAGVDVKDAALIAKAISTALAAES